MTTDERVDNYLKQNVATHKKQALRLTPKQRRRANHKLRRENKRSMSLD
jgi:hypothetical protein